MEKEKKVLVLGGTGAMGVYLVPELLKMGYRVDVASLDDIKSDNPMLNYIKGDAKNIDYLSSILGNKYDGIVDFLIYPKNEFNERYELLLNNTAHYIYLSSYRIYGKCKSLPITENSERLLDTSPDKDFLATDDYSLFKARGENLLRQSSFNNWTIVRPAITYSKRRFQLVTLEADIVVYRALNHLPLLLPREAMDIEGTMSWAGDVAKMLSRLLFNERALCEAFTVSTSEHHKWKEIAEYYKELIGLEYHVVDAETFLRVFNSNKSNYYQLFYDRCFNRVIDNSKVLSVTGIKNEDITTLYDGLKKELSGVSKDTFKPSVFDNNINMLISRL